ncbi:hypothetical protein [Coprobacter fastidiosus]|uniref:Lipoprotein n=1 Tax=Coprobacter fastidiosus NSB1 = JCM 33896 TaxID=1349822 RepID=A0A495WJC7_9BACT|nr:hypothetical protein [Coprobacter fastidiosus]ERM90139.1 hypothetical protein NSB1T_06045 [Coprobacter fastidiosus NSB1 = JCM 33896]RKT59978.1 hypothetical protein BC742_0907 [Coprobacter fastidiosus NSB1 = JCM 33896]BEG62325.1 hypothetical protein Cfast33896_12800 [Coprobacter fastidiosus]
MKNLFYGIILLHLIFWVSCTGSPRSREVKEPESSAELLSDSDSLTTFDFGGNWAWSLNRNEIIVSMKILTDKDSVGYYIYTYYFGNRIEQGTVKLLSQEGRNAVLLVEYNDLRLWSAKFNATMLTDTTFFLTRQDHDGYYLEDSIVMKREYPKSNTAEIWRSMEEYQTKNEALKEKGVYLK